MRPSLNTAAVGLWSAPRPGRDIDKVTPRRRCRALSSICMCRAAATCPRPAVRPLSTSWGRTRARARPRAAAAARHLAPGSACPFCVHLHIFQRPLDLWQLARRGSLRTMQWVGDVLGHRAGTGRFWEHHAEFALVRWRARDGQPFRQIRLRSGDSETGEHHQRGGFARARGQQRQELAALDVRFRSRTTRLVPS